MDVITEDICKVLDYTIIEYRITEKGEVVDTFYNIRNGEGEVFSQNFSDLTDPIDLLLGIELSLK